MSALLIDKMIMAARSYLPKAHESVVRNRHMNALDGSEKIDRKVTDALIVDFINYVGMYYGIDTAVYTVDVSSHGYDKPNDPGSDEDDIMMLPLGTRFYVINGNWYGRISGTLQDKEVFVEATGKTFPLTKDHGLSVSVGAVEQNKAFNYPKGEI